MSLGTPENSAIQKLSIIIIIIYSHSNRTTSGGVYVHYGIYSHSIGLPLVEFMYLVFTRIPR